MSFEIFISFLKMLITFPRLNYIVRYCFTHGKQKYLKVKMENEPLPPCRADPIITKLDTPEFKSVLTPEVNVLAKLFKDKNYELRIAGGAVRDILMGIRPKDLDFATDATPPEMKQMFEESNIRMINAKGEKHGTITARINEKENFEVTTLRIDVVTDGRKAEVLFTKDWKLDALRRDLTINSMFLDLEGKVYDYFFGYDDLKKRKVTFVGNAATRIKEDYLRILRFFRFVGRIADVPNTYDEVAIQAIKENISGIGRISGERIWSEMSKILSGNQSFEITLTMIECGIARYVGLPENPNIERFEALRSIVKDNVSLKPITLLSQLLRNEEDVENLQSRLKLSGYDRDLAFFLLRHRYTNPSSNLVKTYMKILIHWKGKATHAKEYIIELLNSKGLSDIAEEFEQIVVPRFPVNGHMLTKIVPDKKEIGFIITRLKNIWLDKNFEPNAEELLQEVPRILDEIKS